MDDCSGVRLLLLGEQPTLVDIVWGEISMCSGRSHRLSDDDRSVLSFLKNRVLTAPPILVQPCQLQTWYIFTDGSCESQTELVELGGVLMDRTEGYFVTFKFGAAWSNEGLVEQVG